MRQFLHVGCGQKDKSQTTNGFNTDDWLEVRFDIDPSVNPDIVGTMTDLSDIGASSFDAIYSSHNIEHLYPHEVDIALREFHRVLNDDGFLVLTCPDLLETARLISEDKLTDKAYDSPAGSITPLDILYGHIKSLKEGHFYMAHKTGFTEKTIRAAFSSAGFVRFATTSRKQYLDIWAIATKTNVTDDKLREMFITYSGL